MSDFDTKLRAIADAGSAAAFQPRTEELLGRRRGRRPGRRRTWVPVGLVAAATAGIVALAVTQPWRGGPDGSAAADGCAGLETTIAYLLSGSNLPSAQLADTARSRVAALTVDGCVTSSAGAVAIRLGSAGRAAIPTPDLLRADLSVAPVSWDCQGLCLGVKLAPGSAIHDVRDGGQIVVDQTRAVGFSGHVKSAVAQLLPQSNADWSVNVELDSTAAGSFAVLTDALVSQAAPGNRLAVIDHGLVLTAPQIQSAITDGNLQISGAFTEQSAKQLAARLSAPYVPPAVQIDSVPSSS